MAVVTESSSQQQPERNTKAREDGEYRQQKRKKMWKGSHRKQRYTCSACVSCQNEDTN